MQVSNWEVARSICCKPRNDNIFWKYVLVPTFWIIIGLITLGILYLYLVPFTNVIGHALFADFTCPSTGVWQVCGRVGRYFVFDHNGSDVIVGFLVFLIIQCTVGFFIIGSILYGFSRQQGRVKRFIWADFWINCDCYSNGNTENWISTELGDNAPCCCDGQFMYYNSTAFLAISIFITTLIVGIYGGRAIAVNTVSTCTPYVNTSIGLYGCVSNADGSYVGGKACADCAGTGLVILAFPLLVLELLVMTVYIFIKRCRPVYKETKERLDKEIQQRLRQQNDLEFQFQNSIVVGSISRVEMIDGNDEITCGICYELNKQFELPCGHKMCKICIDKIQSKDCPFCRGHFSSKDVRAIEEVITL